MGQCHNFILFGGGITWWVEQSYGTKTGIKYFVAESSLGLINSLHVALGHSAT